MSRSMARILLVPWSLAVIAAPGPSDAFSQIFAFGDSLSDTGHTLANFATAPGGTCASGALFPEPPYVDGSCTNGETWLEVLASDLALSVEPGTAGGTNFAVGGATAATDILAPFGIAGNSEDLVDQRDRFQAANPVVDPNALYVIVAGGNDIQFTARGAIVPAPGQDIAQDAVDAIMALAMDLSALGAQNFLFASVYDMGLIPDPTLSPAQRTAATALTDDFNAALASAVGSFAGGTAYFLDMAGVVDDIYANPGALGITDTTSACVISGTFGQPQDVATPCGGSVAVQDTYLYIDEIHPTRVVHAEIGAAALAAVPEPSTALLVGLGVAGLAARAKSGRRRGDRR
jgi:outer membrane lipase/esterase